IDLTLTFPVAVLLLLLLLGLSQAHPLMEERGGGEDQVEEDHTTDITTRILTANNGSNEILLEGDILLPKSRNAIKCQSYQSCLWQKDNNGLVTIPFTISSEYSSGERQLIRNALQSFHSQTCVRFVDRQYQNDYISIESQNGCFSPLGRQGGKQVLSLNRQGCIYFGIVQHEVNHALGFQHEQTRSDRDYYVQDQLGEHRPTDGLQPDKTAFSINGRDTITPIPNPNVQIGQRQGMSYWDITRINLLYGC
uniref:Metalloendopeptidase n=1 Tax=Oreochromis aureus TaxID=47969 RepID=A0AAZ1XJ49_OREAU